MNRFQFSLFGLFLLSASVFAGEVSVHYISDKSQPYKKLPKDGEQNLIKLHGEEMGKKLWALQLEMAQKDPMFYAVTLGNNDKIRKATGVELQVEFYDRLNNKLGEKLSSFQVEIPPDESKNVSIDCEKYGDPCRKSHKLWAEVRKTSWVELKYGNEDEVAFEWNDVRWFVENAWTKEKKLTLRSFSNTAYGDKDFDGRVFPPSGVDSDKSRYYRVVKEPIPAGFLKDSELYDTDTYWPEALPGFIVENGQKKSPRMLDTDISNLEVQGTIALGEYVQIKSAYADKKVVLITIAPVCVAEARHRALRSKIRFVMGKEKVKDVEAIDQAVREWVAPVSVGEVARTCGPNSGRLVRRWDAQTTVEQVETELGPAEARSEVKGGEVLAYGTLRLKFINGKLAGFDRRSQ